MQAHDAFQQKFKKDIPHAFGDRMILTERGLLLGGAFLAKMSDDVLCIDGEEERILTLLAIAYRGSILGPPLAFLRRVSKLWQSGNKCLAAIHLAQSGFGKLDEEASYRILLAAELMDAGVAPRKLARELRLPPMQPQITKYNENQPRAHRKWP
jgi:hypothetical protein